MSALVIDDDTFMLAYIGDMLRELGAGAVTTAKTGAEGCKALDGMRTGPDVILCDINMPDTDGFEFMQKLAEREFKGAVVMISGTGPRTMQSASLMARFHRLNFLGCLAKPVDAAALKHMLAGRG